MNFGDLATFPLEDDDWITTVLIGGVLVILGFLFVPILTVYGYVVASMRGGVAGESTPPQFDDWGALTVDGLKALVVLFAYQIVPLVFFFVFGLGSILALASGTESGAGLGIVGLLGTMAVFTLLSLVFGYVGMAAVVNLAVEGSMGAAFDFGTLTTVVTSSDWLMAWVFYIGISIVVGIVSSIGITAPFASFYGLSAGGRAFGEAFAAATGTTRASPSAAAEPA